MATVNQPAAGEKFYPCLESEAIAGKTDKLGHGPLGGKNRKTKPLTIDAVYHETKVPEGMARTWCVKVGDTCYDAAWSETLKAWVYGGANSGLNAEGKPQRKLVIK